MRKLKWFSLTAILSAFLLMFVLPIPAKAADVYVIE